jgi:hypothetical protein
MVFGLILVTLDRVLNIETKSLWIGFILGVMDCTTVIIFKLKE